MQAWHHNGDNHKLVVFPEGVKAREENANKPPVLTPVSHVHQGKPSTAVARVRRICAPGAELAMLRWSLVRCQLEIVESLTSFSCAGFF